jgi:transposase
VDGQKRDEIRIHDLVKDTGIVGYNVQIAVDTRHHLIVAHEVTNVGTDRHQLANMAMQARDEMAAETVEVVADRGYYDGEEIRTCEESDITVTLPKPMTSGAKAAGRFGKQDFVYVAADDVYRCPAGERLTYHYMNVEDGKTLRRYWTSTCKTCALRAQCARAHHRAACVLQLGRPPRAIWNMRSFARRSHRGF